MSSYYKNEPWKNDEFFWLLHEEIINIKQSQDQTLDKYLAYFDSLVANCPHHGFTRINLIQRFLGGMMPLERKRFNDVAGCSLRKLTVGEAWRLINDLAKNTKQGQWHQTKNKAPTMEVDSVQNEPDTTPITSLPTTKPREDIGTRVVMDVEAALKEPILEPTGPTKDEDSQITEEESAKLGPALTEELLEKDLALVVEVPQLVPSVCIRIIAPEDKVINEEVQGELEAGQRQEKTTMEHSLVMSQEKPAENSLVLGWQFISATKKRVSKGARLRSLGKRLNFQNYKDANRPYTKKRQRHGPVQWKPGRKNKRARLIEPAAMVKGPQPSQKQWKEKTPKPWSSNPSKKSGKDKTKINTETVAKFDLSHPWDPNQ